MQKLIDTLKSFGIEIPEDKQADVKKVLSENYKNAKEVAKTLSNLSESGMAHTVRRRFCHHHRHPRPCRTMEIQIANISARQTQADIIHRKNADNRCAEKTHPLSRL